MFNQLLKLFESNRNNTPLEDYSTEIFSGILIHNEDIKNDFLQNYLKLPKDNYLVQTQKFYELPNNKNCIIDIVIKGANSICFIENKIESPEGDNQLPRYIKVLNHYVKSGLKTYLTYCTKYYDKKKLNDHNFRQIRWYDLYNFLKKYKKNEIVNEFLEFLRTQQMANELKLNAKDYMSFENLKDIISLTYDYLNLVKPIFEEKFHRKNVKISDGISTKQILEHNRLIFYQKRILSDSDNDWSDIKYGIDLTSLSIFVGIYLDETVSQYSIFLKEIEKSPIEFQKKTFNKGTAVNLEFKLSPLLNDPEIRKIISNWYKDSFNKFESFIKDSNSNLNWKFNGA